MDCPYVWIVCMPHGAMELPYKYGAYMCIIYPKIRIQPATWSNSSNCQVILYPPFVRNFSIENKEYWFHTINKIINVLHFDDSLHSHVFSSNFGETVSEGNVIAG